MTYRLYMLGRMTKVNRSKGTPENFRDTLHVVTNW